MAQSLFTIYRFLLHDETRQIVLANDDILFKRLNLLSTMEFLHRSSLNPILRLISSLVSLQQNDENESVRNQASNCLSIVSVYDWEMDCFN